MFVKINSVQKGQTSGCDGTPVLEIPTGPPVRGRQLWRRTGNFLLFFLQFDVYDFKFKPRGPTTFLTEFQTLWNSPESIRECLHSKLAHAVGQVHGQREAAIHVGHVDEATFSLFEEWQESQGDAHRPHSIDLHDVTEVLCTEPLGWAQYSAHGASIVDQTPQACKIDIRGMTGWRLFNSVAWRHQAITWTNSNFSSVNSLVQNQIW